jgi:hypothetical protein
MSFRTGFTSNSKTFAGLSFDICLTYLEARWNKLGPLGKSILEALFNMWRLAGRLKSFETCNYFEGQPCMIAESPWNGTIRLDDTQSMA